MIDEDTAKLVRRAAAGDELAWRRLIDGLGPLLRRVSSTYRLGEAEAADAVAAVARPTCGRGGSYVCTAPQGGETFGQAIRRRSRPVRPSSIAFATVEYRRPPPQPMAGLRHES